MAREKERGYREREKGGEREGKGEGRGEGEGEGEGGKRQGDGEHVQNCNKITRPCNMQILCSSAS